MKEVRAMLIEIKTCDDCKHRIPVGDGEYTCEEYPGSVILDDHSGGDDFLICNGADFEE